MIIELTREEMEAVEDFISIELLDSIRRDEALDNLNYVQNILTVRAKFQKAIKEDKANAN